MGVHSVRIEHCALGNSLYDVAATLSLVQAVPDRRHATALPPGSTVTPEWAVLNSAAGRSSCNALKMTLCFLHFPPRWGGQQWQRCSSLPYICSPLNISFYIPCNLPHFCAFGLSRLHVYSVLRPVFPGISTATSLRFCLCQGLLANACSSYFCPLVKPSTCLETYHYTSGQYCLPASVIPMSRLPT